MVNGLITLQKESHIMLLVYNTAPNFMLFLELQKEKQIARNLIKAHVITVQ